MLRKLKRLRHSKTSKKFFKIVLFIMIFNVLIAVLGTYLGTDVSFFSGKSAMHIISNLLFLEGAVFLVVGGLLETGTAYSPKEKTTDSREGSHEKHISRGVFFMIVGVGLTGLSVIIGLLIWA